MIEIGAHRMSVPLYTQDQHCLDASVSNHTRGSILIGLCYNTRRRSLVVQVKRCAGLIVMDNNGFSDPFVKLYVPLLIVSKIILFNICSYDIEQKFFFILFAAN